MLLPPQELMFLPSQEYDDVCPITLEKFHTLAQKNDLAKGPCGHKFSKIAIKEWIRDKPTCPYKCPSLLKTENLVSVSIQVEDIVVDALNCNEIPRYCATLAKKLEDQPRFDGDGYRSDWKKSKILPLKSFDNARICGLFNLNAAEILGNRCWYIFDFGTGNARLDAEQRWIRQGVELGLFDRQEMCSLDELEKTYEQILESMQSGWVASIAKEHPLQNPFVKNHEEFDLFIKKTTLKQEDTLIRFLASKFSLEDDVFSWSTSQGCCYNHKKHDHEIYLWVKKSSSEKVLEKFGFKFLNVKKCSIKALLHWVFPC